MDFQNITTHLADGGKDLTYIMESYEDDDLRYRLSGKGANVPTKQEIVSSLYALGTLHMIEYDNQMIGWERFWVAHISACDIGLVIVPPEFRKCGLGSHIVQKMIDQVFEIFPFCIWHTHIGNEGSIALAKKFNFKLIPDTMNKSKIWGFLHRIDVLYPEAKTTFKFINKKEIFASTYNGGKGAVIGTTTFIIG